MYCGGASICPPLSTIPTTNPLPPGEGRVRETQPRDKGTLGAEQKGRDEGMFVSTFDIRTPINHR